MKLRRCPYSQWEHFRCFHYDPETFNISAQCYWVEDDNGKRIGFRRQSAYAERHTDERMESA